MAPQVTAASPALCDADGGVRVTLSGSFVLGRAYYVYFGTDATGVACYSGVSGQGARCVALDDDTLTCALPAVAPGDVPLFVVDATDGSGASVTGLVRAEAPFLHAMTYSLRRNMRVTLNVGDLDPSTLPDAVVTPEFQTI